jgi:predicted metalloprotease with PDZ domain
MLLDLKLREMSEHRQSLDSLMKRLWEDYKKPGYTGYTRHTILNHLKEMGFVEAEAFYLDFIAGQKNVLQALQAILPTAGLQLEQVALDSFVRSRLGLKLTPNADGTAIVAGIIPGSPAWATALQIGDVLLSIQHEMPGINPDELLIRLALDHESVEIAFVSRGIHREGKIWLNTGFEEVGYRFVHTGLTGELKQYKRR